MDKTTETQEELLLLNSISSTIINIYLTKELTEGSGKMVDWNDIKKAFERDAQKAEKKFVDNEQQLLKSIAVYIGEQKGGSAIQEYNPTDTLAFLAKPIPEIKTCLGGEWLNIDNDKMNTLVYSLTKKVEKSDTIIPWN